MGDKAAITKIVDDAIKWMDTNQTASKDDFEAKKKEVEDTVGPLLQKMAGAAGGAGGMPGGMPPGAGGMPGGMPPGGFGGAGGFPGAAAAAGAGGDAADEDDGPNIEEVD